jgi:hypothetical protein
MHKDNTREETVVSMDRCHANCAIWKGIALIDVESITKGPEPLCAKTAGENTLVRVNTSRGWALTRDLTQVTGIHSREEEIITREVIIRKETRNQRRTIRMLIKVNLLRGRGPRRCRWDKALQTRVANRVPLGLNDGLAGPGKPTVAPAQGP